MDTNQLTADYIWSDGKDEERLQMALHVYLAMPGVREYLIGDIFRAVGDRLDEKVSWEQLDRYDNAVRFCNDKTGDYWIGAQVWSDRQPKRLLRAGLYTDDDISARQKVQIKERFGASSELTNWSYGGNHSDGNWVAFGNVHHDHGGGRLDQDDWLKRAVRNREKEVSALVETLLQIYQGMFGRM